MTFFPQPDIAVRIGNFVTNKVIYYNGINLGTFSGDKYEDQYWYLIPGEGNYRDFYRIKHFQTGRVLSRAADSAVAIITEEAQDDLQYWKTTWGVMNHSGFSALTNKFSKSNLYSSTDGKLYLYDSGPSGPYDDQYWKFLPDDPKMPLERAKRDLGLTAAVAGTIASTVGAAATVYSVIPSTDSSNYIKLSISNVSTTDFYLASISTASDLNFMQPTILRGSSGTYMCRRANLESMKSGLVFWMAPSLYTSSWSDKAFYVKIYRDKATSITRLVVKECNKGDTPEQAESTGKEVVNLDNSSPAQTSYNRFYDSYIYASYSQWTENGSIKIDMDIQIGGNPV